MIRLTSLLDRTFDVVVNVLDHVADGIDKTWDLLSHRHRPKF